MNELRQNAVFLACIILTDDIHIITWVHIFSKSSAKEPNYKLKTVIIDFHFIKLTTVNFTYIYHKEISL